MKTSPNSVRIGIAVAIILGTIGWLAFLNKGESKQYLVHIPELLTMGDKVYTRHLRVDGFVSPGSIEHDGPHVTFVMNEFESHSPKAATGRVLTVVYKGSEPPPDTFKDDAMAVAIGSYGRDGVFHASELQAKCASKYAPATPNGKPGAVPAQPASAPSNSPRAAVQAPPAANQPAAPTAAN
jgi:cytochrome c-type biogenesis protein CcmE